MGTVSCFSESKLKQLRDACHQDPRVAALYAFDLRRSGECNIAAVFTETPPWPERLELELAVARALGMEGVELIDLRRMPLIFRYDVVNRGEPIYVGDPEVLAVFIEETIVRYSAFYPLLEALYWKVETKPLAADMLPQ
ncbi:MAG: hypothetical protein ACK2UA_11740 [Anaerolineae bacterium]|jgi:hypothetical protein